MSDSTLPNTEAANQTNGSESVATAASDPGPQVHSTPADASNGSHTAETIFSDAFASQSQADTGDSNTVADTVADTQPTSATDAPARGNSEVSAAADVVQLLDQAQQLGIDTTNIQSEAELATAVLDQVRSMQPYVQYANQVLPHQAQFQEFLAGQSQGSDQQGKGQATPGTTPANGASANAEGEFDPHAYLSDKYGGPQWKPQYQHAIDNGMVERDPNTGLYRPANGFELMATPLIGEMNNALQHQNDFWKKLTTSNPYETFYDVLREPMLREVDRRVNDALQSRESQSNKDSVVSSFEQANEAWLYGTDPSTGQRVVTQDGQRFFSEIKTLQSKGLTDPQDIFEIAQLRTGLGATKADASSAPQATSQATQPNQANQGAAATQTPPAPAADSQTTQAVQATQATQPQASQTSSFLQNALDRAAHAPNAATPTPAASPETVSQQDLENLFVRAQETTT